LSAKLYKYTNDAHYLDVARILLNDTKAMLALPGRTYDLAGPGSQQEHWSLGNRRGFGGHRGWLLPGNPDRSRSVFPAIILASRPGFIDWTLPRMASTSALRCSLR